MFYNDIHSVGYKSAKQAFYRIPLKKHGVGSRRNFVVKEKLIPGFVKTLFLL